MRCSRLASLTIAGLILASSACAQQTPMHLVGNQGAAPPLTAVSPGIWRLEGNDESSGIHYVRLFLLGSSGSGTVSEAAANANPPDLNLPTLTGQCTRDAAGKLHFELFANFGGASDPAFYPPWKPSAQESFPPPTQKVLLTMEFLGYTRAKPFKRQFEQVSSPGAAQLRYLNPGRGSSNLEPPGWFFQYLRALPTLRLSDGSRAAEFPTGAWLTQLHKEPACAASGA